MTEPLNGVKEVLDKLKKKYPQLIHLSQLVDDPPSCLFTIDDKEELLRQLKSLRSYAEDPELHNVVPIVMDFINDLWRHNV